MSANNMDVAAYNQALVKALRSTNPAEVRRFAATWGKTLNNRGLTQLAHAEDALVERRMWMMIRDRPDLGDLHDRANAWLAQHP
jgi:hypothetical protein